MTRCQCKLPGRSIDQVGSSCALAEYENAATAAASIEKAKNRIVFSFFGDLMLKLPTSVPKA